MYLMEGLAQLPAQGSAFAGTLGRNPRSPAAQAFLEKVRKRPLDYKKLLLTVTFHPWPIQSNFRVNDPSTRESHTWLDFVMFNDITEEDLDELRLIRDACRKANKDFRRQIETELELQNTMFKSTGRVVRDEVLRTRGNLVPKKLRTFFIRASEPDFDLPYWQAELGRSFAHQMLSKMLRRRIITSEVAEAHLTWLGKLLGKYAKEFQKKDAGFEQQVQLLLKKKP